MILLLPALLLIIVSIPASITATLVNAKRINSIVGSISHASIGGIGFVVFMNYQFNIEINPIYGSILISILFALIIFFNSQNPQKENAMIESLWPLGFSLGLLFISKTPSYVDIESYLFGNSLLFISLDNIIVILVLSLVLLVCSFFLYYRLIFFLFDPSYLEFKGINTRAIYLYFLLSISITTVLLVFFVGVVLTISLFTLPYLIANFFTKRLNKLMVLSFFISAFFNLLGLILSYYLDVSPAIAISLSLSTTYFVVALFKKN